MAVLTADSGPAGGGLSVDTAPVATALLERPALNIRTLAEMRIITGPTAYELTSMSDVALDLRCLFSMNFCIASTCT